MFTNNNTPTILSEGSFLLTRSGDLIPVALHVPSTTYIGKGIFHLSCVDGGFLLAHGFIDREDLIVILKYCLHEFLKSPDGGDCADESPVGLSARIRFQEFAELKHVPEAGKEIYSLNGTVSELLSAWTEARFWELNRQWYDYLRNNYVKVVRIGNNVSFRLNNIDAFRWEPVISECIRKNDPTGNLLTLRTERESGKPVSN